MLFKRVGIQLELGWIFAWRRVCVRRGAARGRTRVASCVRRRVADGRAVQPAARRSEAENVGIVRAEDTCRRLGALPFPSSVFRLAARSLALSGRPQLPSAPQHTRNTHTPEICEACWRWPSWA